MWVDVFMHCLGVSTIGGPELWQLKQLGLDQEAYGRPCLALPLLLDSYDCGIFLLGGQT